jgi:hypothetical protein
LRLPASEAAAEVFNSLLGAQLLLVATAMVAMVLKLHRSRGRERQQLKWFVYAVVVAVTAFIGGIVVLGAGHLFPVFALIPATAGYAILRHRLYDIDRVISRTVTYALLTALVAAVFQPARRRIQKAVNRRFNRRGYDADRTIDAFSTRLRDQLDLDALESALVVVVSNAMEPAALSLWLRTPEGRR